MEYADINRGRLDETKLKIRLNRESRLKPHLCRSLSRVTFYFILSYRVLTLLSAPISLSPVPLSRDLSAPPCSAALNAMECESTLI